MDFLLTYGLGRMKHFSFVYFTVLPHDSGEWCSHFCLAPTPNLLLRVLDSERQTWLLTVFYVFGVNVITFSFFPPFGALCVKSILNDQNIWDYMGR